MRWHLEKCLFLLAWSTLFSLWEFIFLIKGGTGVCVYVCLLMFTYYVPMQLHVYMGKWVCYHVRIYVCVMSTTLLVWLCNSCMWRGVLLCSCVCVWKWGWWSTSWYWMARKNHPCTPPPGRNLADLTWCGQPHPKCPAGLLPNTHTQTRAHLFFLYWNTIDLQCCVSFRCTAKWFNCICICVCVCVCVCILFSFFSIISYYKMLRYYKICYTVGSSWLTLCLLVFMLSFF